MTSVAVAENTSVPVAGLRIVPVAVQVRSAGSALTSITARLSSLCSDMTFTRRGQRPMPKAYEILVGDCREVLDSSVSQRAHNVKADV